MVTRVNDISSQVQCQSCKTTGKFARYFCDDECLGMQCRECWKEWLLPEYVPADHRVDSTYAYEGKKYVSYVKQSCTSESPIMQVTSSREEINPNYVAESLKPGDHVMWHREKLIWHHAIVVEVQGYNITLIHFTKNDRKELVVEKNTLDARQENGQMYLIHYANDIRKNNPSELVLARAHALIGTTGYHLLKKNCEHFATYCKTGVKACQQSEWLYNKLKEVATGVFKAVASKITSSILKVGAAELMELGLELKFATTSLEMVGVGLIFVFEAGVCIWDLSKLYHLYSHAQSDGKRSLSRKDFISEAIVNVSEHLFAAGGAAAAGYGLSLGLAAGFAALGTIICPGLGTVIGAVLGGFIGGVAGGIAGFYLGRTFGFYFGQRCAMGIAATIKMNDRAVLLNDILPGDHIVLYGGNALHPRCHAIVRAISRQHKALIVIRKTYKKGVVQEVVPFEEPVYRVTYPKSISTYSAEEIVMRAVNALDCSTESYNILSRNCKHFVYSITVNADRLRLGLSDRLAIALP